MELAGEERFAATTLFGVDRGGVHQLLNAGPTDLVTVHVYAPPLTELSIYSTTSSVVERHSLRYTLADDLL